jgi:hypothetical protein
MIPDEDAVFMNAVLAVTARLLEAGPRIDIVVDAYLERHAEAQPIERADLLICTAECLRMLTNTGDGPPVDFRSFAETCRVVGQVISPKGDSLIQRTLQHLNTAGKAYRQVDEGLRRGGPR